MTNKLIEYGFDDWQVERLLSNKVLKTSHGTYKIVKSELLLKRDTETKYNKVNL